MLIRKPLVNNQIRAHQVRVIDETGRQMGIFPLEEALRLARERNLDLVQVTEKVEPPVCKIIDFGKYLYSEEKKRRKAQKQIGQLKQIRLSFAISLHDLEIKAKMAERFLKRGDKVKIEMLLRGREKSLFEFAKGKIDKFLEILEKFCPIKIERELKKEPRGLTMIISKK